MKTADRDKIIAAAFIQAKLRGDVMPLAKLVGLGWPLPAEVRKVAEAIMLESLWKPGHTARQTRSAEIGISVARYVMQRLPVSRTEKPVIKAAAKEFKISDSAVRKHLRRYRDTMQDL